MSSVAMALTGIGKGQDPGSMNAWLTENNGYYGGNGFLWASINPFGVRFVGRIPNSNIAANIACGNLVMMNVRGGSHWVLATEFMGNTIYVNDSGFSNTSYSLSEVIDGNTGVYNVLRIPVFLDDILNTIYRASKLRKQKE